VIAKNNFLFIHRGLTLSAQVPGCEDPIGKKIGRLSKWFVFFIV
jgi:hypothetical protein